MGLMSEINKPKYILGIIFFLILSATTIKSSFSVLKSKERLDSLNGEVARLEEEMKKIESEIEFKKSNEYIEEKARNDLNLIKPGERVYIVKGGDDRLGSVLSDTDQKVESEEEKPNWYSWYRLFFDN